MMLRTASWKYLLLCFSLTWMVWIPGTLLRADSMILSFGSAGPALAAIWIARRGDKTNAGSAGQIAPFAAVWLVSLLVMEIFAGGSGGWQWPIHWNPWAVALAILPAVVLSSAWSSDTGVRGLLRMMWFPGGWLWPLVSFLAIPAYLLIPAAIARIIGMPLTVPPHPNGWGALAAFGAASFARNFFFTAVFEEPGWRGTLLPSLQERHSPLVASLLVWFPWMLWHAPLDLTGGAAHSLASWLQIRVIFLIPMTILLTWIYNHSGGSLLCTSLFHGGMNAFPFVLPWSRPMLALVFVWAIFVVVRDRMWRTKTSDDSAVWKAHTTGDTRFLPKAAQ